MRRYLVTAAVLVAVFAGTNRVYCQSWLIGGQMGLSSLDRSSGFQLSPTAELLFNQTMGVGTEFSVNTQYGTPLLWYTYFRYYFDIRGSGVRPYANAGPLLALNVPNGPSFGLLVGGGVNIPVAGDLYVAPEIQLGPAFDVGGGTYNLFLYGNYYGTGAYSASSYTVPGETVLFLSVRAGLRYRL